LKKVVGMVLGYSNGIPQIQLLALWVERREELGGKMKMNVKLSGLFEDQREAPSNRERLGGKHARPHLGWSNA